MGKLLDGRWVPTKEQTRIDKRGGFVRGTTKFRDWVRRDGSSVFAPQRDRYHLWVAHNCPWAHRTVITRNLKGLTETVGVSVAHVHRDESGWWFAEGLDEKTAEDGKFALHRLYSSANPTYEGSATVPVLWDREHQTIVCNESAEIVKMLNSEFDGVGGDTSVDLYPSESRGEIDELNSRIFERINNGVYKCGFARTQEAYNDAFHPLFAALDEIESRLSTQRYLVQTVGNSITLADIHLFTTLVRFDAVYFGHFKCNLRRVVDYANLWSYVRDLYQTPGFGETVHIDVYKKGYYGRSAGINPRGIVPLGPELDFDADHDRASRFAW